ncbi:uncharacterized protein F5147DRAFT_767436 [Suillus discolor]|uniref:Zn(2)-C6 fungal-type domain-containing protein n=1 Tax=Suillus discolor TaxID=1912936 RepID=A0A9P7JZT7_9AGAM|nr:uncharacterized protein F5147DRAFT_767436 [Suillus discolor]KAG2118673.1 hypothetical protein F5147DRAFT_767436 [Suillus discolor]
MPSNAITTTAAAATANQALIALLDRLNQLVEQVLRSQSEEEKMGLSRTIASQLNDAIRSYQTVATYIPLHLLSMAAEIHRAQRGTMCLVQVPDWNLVGSNEDICQGHPLYPKTLGPAPNHLHHLPCCLLQSLLYRLPVQQLASLECQPPRPVKKARKAAQKSKWILTDTDTDTDRIRIGNGKVKGKGKGNAKGKAKARSPSLDSDIEQMTIDVDDDLEVNTRNSTRNMMNKPIFMFTEITGVVINTRLMPPATADVTDSEYEPEEDDEDRMEPTDDSQSKRKPNVKPAKGEEPSKSGKYGAGADQPKVKGKGKRPHPKPIGAPLLPCERCTIMHLECESWVTKRGEVAHTCTLCNKWRMKCIRPMQPDTPATGTGTTTTPTPPVTPIATRSKTTAKSKTDINAQHPSPIPEEPDVNVEMDAGVTTTGLPSTAPDEVPAVSADNFCVDRWIELMDDSILPPAPFMDTPDDIRYSPIYPARTQRPPSPPTTSIPLQSHQRPCLLTDLEMQAMLAQIQINMDQLRTCDDMIHDELSHCIDRLQADYTEQLNSQKGLVDHLTVQMGGIARYLRDNSRTTAAMASTPPSFNPPPIVIPGTPIFPEIGSISALGRAITNNVFTPDVFSTNARPGGNGSPVTRHEQAPAPASTSTSTINPVPTTGESGPPMHPVGALLVPPSTVPMESMPSTSTLRTFITGPSNVPADGQSISAPLPNRSFAPQSRQQGRSVSARHAKNTSGNGPK